jgi:hypothetical protein
LVREPLSPHQCSLAFISGWDHLPPEPQATPSNQNRYRNRNRAAYTHGRLSRESRIPGSHEPSYGLRCPPLHRVNLEQCTNQ